MPSRSICSAALAIVLVFAGVRIAVAEVPPIPKKQLAEQAKLVVTGKVMSVEEKVLRTEKDGFKESQFRVTIEVAAVDKGELKDREKPIVALGKAYQLAPGKAGSGGHYSANSNHRLLGVEKGW